jgi:hypothetical protein
VIAVTKRDRPAEGTVFEASDGTCFSLQAAQTREEADRKAATAGPETRVFAVRPECSMPADEWVVADPSFWR